MVSSMSERAVLHCGCGRAQTFFLPPYCNLHPSPWSGASSRNVRDAFHQKTRDRSSVPAQATPGNVLFLQHAALHRLRRK